MIRSATAFLVTAAALTATIGAQEPPGRRLSVMVRVAQFVQRGDTAYVAYVVRNSPESAEEMWDFTVEAPTTVLAIGVPQPQRNWTTSHLSDSYPVVGWDMLGTHLARGAETPELSYRAIGLPAIVTWYAGGYYPVPSYEGTDVDEPLVPQHPHDVLRQDKISGRTVGITSTPPVNALAHAARLDTLALEACTLGWISNHGICNSLRVKLNQAAREIAQGDASHARNRLSAFVHELEAQRGKQVDDNAYWLLKINAEIVLRSL